MANDNSAKKVKPAVMHILKAIVDYRVPGLKKRVSDAVAAQEKISVEENSIKDLEYAVGVASRFDPGEARECKEWLEHHQSVLNSLQNTVKNGRAARDDLRAADKFYGIFNSAIKDSMTAPQRMVRRKQIDGKIAELRAQYSVLDIEAARLDNQISACWINIDSRSTDNDCYAQALSDLSYLNPASEDVEQRMAAIMSEIKKLERQR